MSNYNTRFDYVKTRKETVPVQCGHAAPCGTEGLFVTAEWPGYFRTFEAMTPNSSRDKHSWKDFHHYRRTVLDGARAWRGGVAVHTGCGSREYDIADFSDPYALYCNEYGTAGEHLNGLQPLFDSSMDIGFIPDPANLDDLKAQSLRTMMPYVKSELSLVNSLIELKDFKSLPTTIKRIWTFGKQLPSIWRQTGLTLRRLTHTSADGYLQSQFNILPLMADIAGVRTAISTIRGRINALVSGQGYTRRRHFRRSLTLDDDSNGESVFNGPNPPGVLPWKATKPLSAQSIASRSVITDVAVFHAEILYNYNYTKYQVEHAQLLGMLDALGVNLNPAIIWNAIPWSFVVDWVLGVSRWLDDRKELNMEPVVNIQNYLWSVTYRRRIRVTRRLKYDVRYHEFSPNDTATGPDITLPVVSESAYRRQVDMPSAGSIISSGLNSHEFSLGAALVIARGSHHKRNRSR